MFVMKIIQSTQEKLKSINKAGTVATKARITMDATEANAKESNRELMKPSKFVTKIASAFNKLNIF